MNKTKPARTRHKRLRDWSAAEKIEFEIVPRFKTSSLSGDTWRTSVRARVIFKGEVIAESSYRDMEAALKRFPVWFDDEVCCPLSDRVMELEAKKCDQPGCAEDAVNSVLLKKEYSDQGDELVKNPEADPCERHFCPRHLKRGDASNEDSDKNYLVVKGPGPGEARKRPEDESPARQVTIHADSPEDLPAALAKARKEGKL